MKKRALDYVAISLIYIFSIIASIWIYYLIDSFDLVVRLAIISTILTSLIFIYSLLFKNLSIYDPYWSVIPPLMILFIMIETDNFNTNMILCLVAMSIWSIRLTFNWAINWKSFKHQDFRYDYYKEKYPKFYYFIGYFGIMLFPTFIVYMQLTLVIHTSNLKKYSLIGSIIAFIIVIIGTIIEFISDNQVRKHKKSELKNTNIQSGLWKYSRHPNYLGEILIWIGLYTFHFTSFGLSLAVFAPITMIIMFRFISIPLMENKLINKYSDYLNYMEKTPRLLFFGKLKKKGNTSDGNKQT